ncbi:MAG: EAL domain-containing protein [Proteobacteria bacterium]|nr:EAL domain-containing protein [Pseudomonadota bacterium]
MKFGIAGRISLVVGLLLFLFFVTSAVSYVLTKRIEGDLSRLAGVDDLRRDAVTDMEFRLAEVAGTVFAYVVDGKHINKIRARQAGAEFDRAARTFMRLAATDDEIRLGEEAIAAFERFRAVGAEIIALSDRKTARRAPVPGQAPVNDAAPAAANQGSVDRADPIAGGEIGAHPGIAADLPGDIGSLESLLVSRKRGATERMRAAEAAFDPSATRYREIGLAGATQASLARPSDGFAARSEATGAVTDATDRKRELLAEFDSQRGWLEGLLGAQIVPLVRAARVRTQESASFSTHTITLYILVMTGFGVVIGGGGALVLARRVVRPIRELTAGAEDIGNGRRMRRVAVESDDEIGELADSMIRMARMAETRQQTEQALREMAHHDALTKLPNRVLFQIRLVEAMDNARRVDRMVALHLLDLDSFKDVNDTLGHRAGDMLLQQVSERLKGCLRKSDTVARLGGDEFAIIQTNLTDENDISALAQRLTGTLATAFEIDGESVYTGTSIGITVFPHDDCEVDKLLKNADLALYRAKREGGSSYQLYDPQMNAEIQSRKAIEQDLRLALERGELFIEYQPQIDISSGRIIGAEALSRWRHPERGMVPPDEFIPVAEQSGLISRLTEGVLRGACKQAKAWQDAGLAGLRVSVNLSPSDFKRKDVVPMVTKILEQSGLDPEWLELEITEGMVMSGAESVIAKLEELHALGIQLAIDDFGTGFSSMSYLKRFPVDRLKIDQTFVRDILDTKEDASITTVIINLGHSLGLKVVAEGVEDEAQYEFLRQRNCNEAQGYCISRPLDAEAFVEFVRNHVPREAPPRTLRIA